VDYKQRCDALEAEILALATTARGLDLDTPLTTCPGWDMAQLVKHVGYSHRWANRMVSERAAEVIPFRDVQMNLPEDKAGYPDWLAAGRDLLLPSLRSADPDAAMWAWGADQHVRFWARRQLFETTVHHADALLSAGRAPVIDPAVAVDGVDEFLENLRHAAAFAPNVKDLRGGGESLHFHCTDADGEWMIQLTPEGFTWEHGHGKGSVAVRGAAGDLLLLIYGRLKSGDERFQTFGDATVLAAWFDKAHI
jgi:uncharacterized protein (TIGR03083 family)